MKEVSKEEFFDVLHKYEGTLTCGLVRICEPVVKMYYKGLGDNAFGKIEYDWLGPNGELENVQGEFWKYYLEDV